MGTGKRIGVTNDILKRFRGCKLQTGGLGRNHKQRKTRRWASDKRKGVA